tara:strand:- start:158 stop:559 length:402 start_codon:yes stop_codon:yes gene_type:complete
VCSGGYAIELFLCRIDYAAAADAAAMMRRWWISHHQRGTAVCCCCSVFELHGTILTHAVMRWRRVSHHDREARVRRSSVIKLLFFSKLVILRGVAVFGGGSHLVISEVMNAARRCVVARRRVVLITSTEVHGE